MKKLLCITLICIFAFYLAGMEIGYWLKMDTAKAQAFLHMKTHKLSKCETKVFCFNSAEYSGLNWTEPDKEFIYNSERYDVISVTHPGVDYKMVCYTDNAETEISMAFCKIFESFFALHYHPKNSSANITLKTYREYLSIKRLMLPTAKYSFVSFIQDNANFNSHSAIDDIWHPPTSC